MTSINTTKTRSFQGADIGSDHDLVMMCFRLHLKRCCAFRKSAIRYGRQESGPYQLPSLLSSPFPRNVTFNSVRTTTRSA